MREPSDDQLPAMYTSLAPWWPLLSPPEDYVEEAALITGLIRSALDDGTEEARPMLLELGCGGGHNAVHLANTFDLVLSDASAEMVKVSQKLNPGVEHVVADMRTLRLGRTVDAVLVHDAIDYMTTRDDLAAVFATARAHLAPGGAALFMPDHTVEQFEAGTDHGGSDAPDGSGVRYLEWTWDPDPSDECAQTEFSYITRTADGVVGTFAETHLFGLFDVPTWLELLSANGFEATAIDISAGEDPDDAWVRTVFVASAI